MKLKYLPICLLFLTACEPDTLPDSERYQLKAIHHELAKLNETLVKIEEKLK